MSHNAIIGYGCFGQALGSLIEQSGDTFRAFDTSNPPPDTVRADTLAEAVQGASHIVLAVPVPALKIVLEELLPLLTGDQLVMDVGSVKVNPIKTMKQVLGSSHPWVGTHPLFGPSSIAAGELPLRVVVCPNSEQPQATERAHKFYQNIECLVLDQDAESHDRSMADCHALTYFVAKGLMDAGVNLRTPFTPPSARALAQTVRAVRSDSGHLFGVLHQENPYASDSRARLMEALSVLDRQLVTDKPDVLDLHRSDLVIPGLDERSPELKEAREHIDLIDDAVLKLLAQRMEMAKQAREAKAALGHGVRDDEREKQLLAARKARAEELGLDVDAVDDVFQAVLRFSRRVQRNQER